MRVERQTSISSCLSTAIVVAGGMLGDVFYSHMPGSERVLVSGFLVAQKMACKK
jgi:hypothetical protein